MQGDASALHPGSVPGAAPGASAPRVAVRHEAVLAGLLLLEIGIFSLTGQNFLSLANAMEVTRVSTEIGLLALVLTPVIVTGGIDLSVGSLMGLCAVVFGGLTKDAGLPFPIAFALTLVLGALGGAVNAALITRLRLPPLIVTLGTYSLFRGLGEGLTRGVRNFTDFPETFLDLGQSYLFGLFPAQLPIFVGAALALYLLLERSTIGRGLYAIGLHPEGARHAGIPVERRLALVYTLSGLVASLAAVIYVAHLGQAKADAGTSYELMAITAVVLGGTSIFGGRGTITGTLLGLFAIAVLQNGLRLSDQPAELAGILSGALLVGAILVNPLLPKRGRR
jgi:rhamnose transport system permease protein